MKFIFKNENKELCFDLEKDPNEYDVNHFMLDINNMVKHEQKTTFKTLVCYDDEKINIRFKLYPFQGTLYDAIYFSLDKYDEYRLYDDLFYFNEKTYLYIEIQ